MSALFFAHVKTLHASVVSMQEQIKYLVDANDKLAERVLALEAEKTAGVDLDVDTLEPKRRGRPPKARE